MLPPASMFIMDIHLDKKSAALTDNAVIKEHTF